MTMKQAKPATAQAVVPQQDFWTFSSITVVPILFGAACPRSLLEAAVYTAPNFFAIAKNEGSAMHLPQG